MALYPFPEQTGFFAYEVSINPPGTSGDPALWGFACSGCLDESIVTFLTGQVETFVGDPIVLFAGRPSGLLGFIGWSGKLYDSDGNYFQSYQSGANFTISGHVFPERHNYFYSNTLEPPSLINNNCSRTTGTIDSFYILNVPEEDFSLTICN